MELFAKLVSNVNLKAVNYSRKKSYLRCLTGYRMPVGIYLLKVNIRNTKTNILQIFLEHISHLVLALLLLTLNI